MLSKFFRSITLSLLLIIGSADLMAGEALNLLNEKAYDQAFRKAYVSLIKSADGEASFVLGRIYAEGLGTSKKNQTKALEYLSKAADQNDNREAVLYLATQFAKGEFLQRNYQKALTYYEKAETKGWGNFSKEKLALLGSGQLSPKVCQSLSKIISDKSTSSDLVRFGQCLVDGIGIKKNTDRAKEFLEKSLAKKSVDAGNVLLEKFYLSDLRDFQYNEVMTVFDQILENKPSQDQLKTTAKLIEDALTQLFIADKVDSANTIFYEIATHDLAKVASGFTDPKTMDVTTLEIEFVDCEYAFNNRIRGAATYFCEQVSDKGNSPKERSLAIALMASNAEFFGGMLESIEQNLTVLARNGDTTAIETIFQLYAGNDDKIIALAQTELRQLPINDAFNARIQAELDKVFEQTSSQITDGRITDTSRLKIAFELPHCPTVDLFIEKVDRRELKRSLQSLPTGSISKSCIGYKNTGLPQALEQIRQIDYRSAMDILKKSCGSGSAKACIEMAELYIQNKAPGVDALSDKARIGLYEEILERAIELDETEAYVLLGGLLIEASGGKREERGRDLLERAYSRGSIDALYLMAADELKNCFFCSAKTCQKLASYITRASSDSLYLNDAKALYKKKRCD